MASNTPDNSTTTASSDHHIPPTPSAALSSSVQTTTPNTPGPSQSLSSKSAPRTPTTPREALQLCLENGLYSDLTIYHGSHRWEAHRVILCTQSAVLGSRIQSLNGAHNLHLTHHPYFLVCDLLKYLYTSSYDPHQDASRGPLHAHVEVFALATELEIVGLQELSLTKYCETLKEVSDLKIYWQSVREIYAHDPKLPVLRLAVVETAVIEIERMVAEGSVARKDFLELTSEVRDFQADIFEYLAERAKEYAPPVLCPECGPRDADDTYEMKVECKGCKKMKPIELF